MLMLSTWVSGNGDPLAKIARPPVQRWAASAVHSALCAHHHHHHGYKVHWPIKSKWSESIRGRSTWRLDWKVERWLVVFLLLRPSQITLRQWKDLRRRRGLGDNNLMEDNNIRSRAKIYFSPIRMVGFTFFTVSNKVRPSRPGEWKAHYNLCTVC